ncbi:hypothetical protein [Pseudomonas sp. PS01301]|uniref:hypothetical protein n=1 Tax=Pseudomonas sp. PS01301 TaxID=2991437 RepID=UPI00249ADFED|nr:hypothetical protein [Pseudomonas sp. PS01301]
MQMHSAIDYARLCCAILLELTMKRIDQYRPPEPADLLALKSKLQATSAEMARLAGLTQGSQWRKYTGSADPRALGMHMHFYMAAILTLNDSDMERITATMQAHGAQVGTVSMDLAASTPAALE